MAFGNMFYVENNGTLLAKSECTLSTLLPFAYSGGVDVSLFIICLAKNYCLSLCVTFMKLHLVLCEQVKTIKCSYN